VAEKWISIYESIDGPKLRELCTAMGASEFEAKGILQTLWLWGLDNADKYGEIICVDRDDMERFLYGHAKGCSISPSKMIDALIETRWIDVIDGRMYFHNWAIRQNQWYKYQDRKDAERDRKRRAAMKDKQTDKTEEPEKEIPREKESEKKQVQAEQKPEDKKTLESNYPADFERFYGAYPRKKDKTLAYKAFRARLNDGVQAEDMIRAAEAYALECKRNGYQPQYIKAAKTFIGPNLCYMEYLPEKTEPKPTETTNPFEKNPFEDVEGW